MKWSRQYNAIGVSVKAFFPKTELEEIPLANWKVILAVIKEAEEAGRVSEILWAYYYMASVVENIQESGGAE